MRRLTLTEWAAMAEVIGTVAIVISLMFVAYTIQQNTNALQGQTENILFERHADLADQFSADPTMAEILLKMRSESPQLNDVEAVRWEKYQLNMLDIWALAYTRHSSGLLSQTQWETWDIYFTELFSAGGERISKDYWKQHRYGWDAGFWKHVSQALFESEQQN